MKIVCIGGGPAGLYFGLLMKQLDARHDITVVERNKPYDTFGWGVVFSDATMDNMRQWDPPTAASIQQAFNHWDDIELEFKGRYIRSGGHGFVGIGRKKLLNILQARCEELGVKLQFDTEVDSDADFPDADLVIASDGINSKIRNKYAHIFKPDVVTRPNRFIWLGTTKLYDAFNFTFVKTEHGWFQAHVYKFDDKTTTFIVETPESGVEGAWPGPAQRRGIGGLLREAVCRPPGRPQADDQCAPPARLGLAELPARQLRAVVALQRPRPCGADGRCGAHRALRHRLGHQAGDRGRHRAGPAVQGARAHEPAHIPEVLQRYQALRRVDVLRLQNAAWNAMEWFEAVGQRYADTLPPEQFMYSMLTRSQRISHENLRLRDKAWLEGFERWFAESRRAAAAGACAGAAADVHALHAAQRHAEEPGRRLADGAVLLRRRRCRATST